MYNRHGKKSGPESRVCNPEGFVSLTPPAETGYGQRALRFGCRSDGWTTEAHVPGHEGDGSQWVPYREPRWASIQYNY